MLSKPKHVLKLLLTDDLGSGASIPLIYPGKQKDVDQIQ